MVKILAVEDNTIAANVINYIIKKAGHVVDIAKDCQEAIKLFYGNGYALIFMDIGLPDGCGIDITKQIRNQANLNQNIPIVALTAINDQQNKLSCYNVGMNDVLTKPINHKDILATIHKYTFCHNNGECLTCN